MSLALRSGLAGETVSTSLLGLQLSCPLYNPGPSV